MTPRYCEIALPVPLRSTFTYAIPQHLSNADLIGSRVVVPFRNRAMVGVVVALVANPSEGKKTKEIVELLDAVPALPPKLIELGIWVSRYYVAPIGETLRAMLPPLAELRPKREYELTDHGRDFLAEMKERGPADPGESVDLAILELLHAGDKPVPSARVRRIVGGEAAAERLVRRGCLIVSERMRHKRERTQKIVAWNPAAMPGDAKEEKVREILTATRGPLPVPILLKAGASRAVVARLEKEGKLTSWEEPFVAHADEESAEDAWETDFVPPANVLNADQKSALAAVGKWLAEKSFVTSLLHGVTGSGKTEIYLGAVEATLAQSRTAIVLVPEFALTLWLSRLVRARFGGIVAVLHSRLAENERSHEWWRVRRGEARVVVGTRSAVFAPLENVGLIIVDEEQESSYKQEETPRYHGRDVAIVRAKTENALALLGSATPSLETYHHAREGKYELLAIAARVASRPLPSVEVISLREEFQQTHKTSAISSALHVGIEECLTNGTQALILINRRGYSWSVLCRSCGASVQCINCSISVTHHKSRNRLECHYCGSIQQIPKQCPKCQSKYVYFFGEGSEQLEERLRHEFPKARIARLDRDTARTKRQFQETLGAFAGGALDILVGTQMLAKGHDFHRVTLVGVVSADASLTMPDFRAAERTFQLLTQVAGRAGRGDLPGRVLIQTYFPDHYAIQDAVKQDYASFFERELHFRRVMAYPPFTSLANVIVRDTSLEKAIQWSRQISEYFAPFNNEGVRVLGPAAAPLAKLKREHRFQFLLKSKSRAKLTQLLSGALSYCDTREIPQTAILADVDPLSLL